MIKVNVIIINQKRRVYVRNVLFFVYTTLLNLRIIVKNNVLKQMTSCLTYIENILSYNGETAQKYKTNTTWCCVGGVRTRKSARRELIAVLRICASYRPAAVRKHLKRTSDPKPTNNSEHTHTYKSRDIIITIIGSVHANHYTYTLAIYPMNAYSLEVYSRHM